VTRDRWAAAAASLVPAAVAIAVAALLAGVILALTGADPLEVGRRTLEYGTSARSATAVIDRAIPYYLAGIAAAIAFRAQLFNIGIDGQYRLAVLAAAAVGAAVTLPGPLHIALMVGVAMLVGAGWAAIAGLLAAYRGVSVVIGTIMLNAIATGLIAWLLDPSRLGVRAPGSNNLSTAPIPESGWLPALPTPLGEVNGALLGAIAVGVATWLLLGRTRYGFDLRALGTSLRAARVSGVDVRRTIVTTMLLSGAIAGLVGLPGLLGDTHAYGLDFPAGLGWTGISIAILGRNHPVGIAVGALLWAWLERSAQILDLMGVSREVVTMLQAVIVIAVVVAWELTRRASLRRQRRLAGMLDQEDAADGPIAAGSRA
jgi:simple sugar transport system permease protein